jgi:nucleotide-binding universal stress UspA family protein
MSNARRIFVALDASDAAPLVLDASIKLAELVGGTLIVFRAVGVPPDLPHEVFEVTDLRLEEMLLSNARKDLELRAKRANGRVEKIHVVFGTAWDAICREAKETNADLIVIGSHGHSRLARMLGTTAAKVVNNADRNVLVVRTAL